MLIIRSASLVFALMNIVGLIWFLDATKTSIFILGIVAVVCAVLVSIAPRNLVANKVIRQTLIVLCATGICALMALIAKDFQREYGPDYGAIVLRILFAYTFAAMALDIYRGNRQNAV
jgi:ABC-type uncharacterized transport system permease subunit